MAKIRKGTTVVLKLDDLYLWIRKQNQHNKNGQIKNGKHKHKHKESSRERFKIVNRPCDFNKLPPCRAKIIYMGIPKFLKTKRLIFGVQLYPPYFGLSQRVYKSINQRRILGKISSKEFKAPLGSMLFITENDIKGIMLKNKPRRISKGTTHWKSPQSINSNQSQHTNHLNFKPPTNESKQQQQNEIINHTKKHFRRQSTMSLACHYRNLDSLANISNLSDSMFWTDDNLPTQYDVSSQAKKIHSDPKQSRFKLDQWLYPIFLDYTDVRTTEIVKDRCQWELTQWIRDEAEGVRTPILKKFYDYMISLSDNLDAIIMNEISKYKFSKHIPNNDELWKLDEINFEFEMMTRIKDLTECVEDALEAEFVLNVIDALQNDIFTASPIIQCVIKYLGNDIRFMIELFQSCSNESMCECVLQTIDRYKMSNSLLPKVWKLVKITHCNQMLIENILINTNNLSERDAETLTIGLLNAFDDELSDNIFLKVFECILRMNGLTNLYIFVHIKHIIKLCMNQKIENNVSKIIKFGINHPLIQPNELLQITKNNANMPDIDQLNLLSAVQLKYEQNQLFLGRYLLYCPIATQTQSNDDYKINSDQDEVEFYDDDINDDDDDDNTAMLVEITLDIDDLTTSNQKQAIMKKCLCVKNNQKSAYEIDHYFHESEIIHEWNVIDYDKKMLQINNTRCQWIPNLKNIQKINPSFSAIDYNADDLNNELRGYLVLLPNEDGILNFVNDLFKEWNKNMKKNKYLECIHRMQERPLFISMEKWKLIDMD